MKHPYREGEDRYILFPLCLLLETYKNPYTGFNLISCYAIVTFAKSFQYKIEDVARQLAYCYLREKEILPDFLLKSIESYIEDESLMLYEDINPFFDGGFDLGDTLEEILSLFLLHEHFKKESILIYQIHQARSILNIKIGSINSLIVNYNKSIELIQDFEKKFRKDAMVSIKLTQLFKFRDSGNKLDLFRAYIAIKSIIGSKKYAATTKPAILSRMIGCKSKATFDYFKNNKYVLSTVQKYSKRYQMDKLLTDLVKAKFIMYVVKKNVSRVYVSHYMEPEELIKIIHNIKAKNDPRSQILKAGTSL